MSTRVEFVGGPYDGEVRMVPEDDPPTIKVFLLDPFVWPVKGAEYVREPTGLGRYLWREPEQD